MAFSFDDDYSSPSHASDEISLFLRQLLHRSSSSPSSSSPALQASSLPSTLEHSGNHNVGFSSSSAATPDTAGVLDGYLRLPDRPVVDRASSFWSGIPAGVCSNLPSSSAAAVESDSLTAGTFQLRSAENEADDYDCESEEGPEEAHPKQTSLRNSSKRSRAAEVHNLSEKRRRSRINEKMKALQNLIPNRNKTDKASMLDEAIEYLKQLQLQVQMLSMRNGLILHPMCLPGFSEVVDRDQLFQMGLNLSDKDGSSHPNIIGNTLPSVPLNQCDASTRPRFDSLPGIVTKEVPFSLQSSMANQLGSFKLLTSSQNICRKDTMAQHQLAIMDPQANALELLAPILTSTSKFHSQPLYLKDDLQGIVQINSTSHTQLISSSLDGLCPGTNEFDTRVSNGSLDRES